MARVRLGGRDAALRRLLVLVLAVASAAFAAGVSSAAPRRRSRSPVRRSGTAAKTLALAVDRSQYGVEMHVWLSRRSRFQFSHGYDREGHYGRIVRLLFLRVRF